MNKKTALTMVFIIAVLFVQNAAGAGSQETLRSISVSGTGTASAEPDIVRLNLGVQTNSMLLNDAIDENNSRMDRVIGVIESFGVDPKDFRTANFSVYYQQPGRYADGTDDKGSYNVNNNIMVTFRDTARIGSFIDAALKAGANQFYGLEYDISDTTKLVKEARAEAVRNALELAGETAALAGVETGKILRISETPGFRPMPVYSDYGALRSSGNGVIAAPGVKAVELTVNIDIEIK